MAKKRKLHKKAPRMSNHKTYKVFLNAIIKDIKKIAFILISLKKFLTDKEFAKSKINNWRQSLSEKTHKTVNSVKELYKTFELIAVSKDYSKLEELKVKILAKKVTIKYSLIVTLTLIMTFVILHFGFRPVVVVYIDNKPIVVASSKKEFDTILQNLETNWENTYNQEIKLNQKPSFRLQILPKRLVSTPKQIAAAIEANTNLLVRAYAIQVNEEVKAYTKDEESAIKVLENIRDKYKADNPDEEISFFEQVSIAEAYAMPSLVLSIDDCVQYLTKNIDASKEYVVKIGDNLWNIASRNGVNIEKLYELNPDVTETLKPGQVLKLSAPSALINIKATEYIAVEEDMPFETKFESDSNRYRGDRKVVIKGKNGKVDLKVAITKQNGIEIGKVILEQNILVPAVTEVIAVGAKPREEINGTGKFRVPAFGSITSRFGFRWGKVHEGIDIGANIGESVYAADGGKVIYAGELGGYGNLVKIDHGNGFVTYYGHNSRILVKVGQRVNKGDVISKIGNTGNSTGPHLHFQVEKNGTPVDPLKYLR